MKSTWIIFNHHLALQDGKNVYHPNASDVYSLLSTDESEKRFGISCDNPATDLPNVRFSKIGSSVHIRLSNNESGEILCNVVAYRKGAYVPVDVLEGSIIDQCVTNNTWFYLNGNTSQVQEIIGLAGIKENGIISTRQYLKLVEFELLNETSLLDNDVDYTCLQKPVGNNEEPPATLKATLFFVRKYI